MKITELKINGICCPVGYEMSECTVTWYVENTAGTRSEQYIVQVAEDDDFAHILYETQGMRTPAGGVHLQMTLAPMKRYFVRVKVTDDKGDNAEGTTWFETGKMDTEWSAEWITYADGEEICPIFRKDFAVKNKITKASLYISAAGVFEAYLNGKKIGNEYLTPYLTDYKKWIQVITFPVEEYLSTENRLEILTGKGWYMGRFGMPARENTYGDKMAVIAELHLYYEDGSEETLSTDDTWKYRASDIEKTGIYDGERINRLLWKNRENEDRPVKVLNDVSDMHGCIDKKNLRDRLSLPVRYKESIPVRAVLHTPAGETVLDLGQNFAGIIEFTADFPSGTEVKLEFGEIL